MSGKFWLNADFNVTFSYLLYAVKLQNGTNGFTSRPKEGLLRIFSPQKSEGFGRVRTRELGYQRPARAPKQLTLPMFYTFLRIVRF
jgi:hypothetical protein